MTLQELSASLKRASQQINADFPQWANVALGNTALAMLKQRIVNTGQASDGSSYKPYSTKPTFIGASSFRTKAAANSVFGTVTKRRALEWRKVRGHNLAILPGGYKQIRQIDGSQVSHKSFLRTGEMWLSIHTLGTQAAGEGKFTTTVGTKVDLSNKKLEGNTAREGKEILMISKKEEQELTKILDKYITNIINKSING